MAEYTIASGIARARLRDPEVKVSGDVRPDDAVSALLRAGSESYAVVTGSLGRGGTAGLLPGPVGLAVAARAVCVR
ncbi:hypothetical protein ACFWOL_10550 [Streptomyces sp. NPDC058442]|uniref:hypothetical protein n=1 Tax=Streptomyces sp. NPDC058442 TaxID=3346503 RepID=UPI0036609E08